MWHRSILGIFYVAEPWGTEHGREYARSVHRRFLKAFPGLAPATWPLVRLDVFNQTAPFSAEGGLAPYG